MKFIQSIAATSLAIAISAPVLAASVSADLYGKVNISLQDSDGKTELKQCFTHRFKRLNQFK